MWYVVVDVLPVLAWGHQGAHGTAPDLRADLRQFRSIVDLSFVVLEHNLLPDLLVHYEKLFVAIVRPGCLLVGRVRGRKLVFAHVFLLLLPLSLLLGLRVVNAE